MTKPKACGPYETEAEVMADTRDVYALIRTGPRPDSMRKANERRLLDACRAAGVQLGAYDRSVLHWLADWEPETVQVIAGLVVRAGRGGAA